MEQSLPATGLDHLDAVNDSSTTGGIGSSCRYCPMYILVDSWFVFLYVKIFLPWGRNRIQGYVGHMVKPNVIYL